MTDDYRKLRTDYAAMRQELTALKRELGLIKETQASDHMTLVTQKQSTELALRSTEADIYNNVVANIGKHIMPKVNAAVNYMNYVNEDPYAAINKYRVEQFAEQTGFDAENIERTHTSRLFFRDDDIDHGPKQTSSNTRTPHLLQHK
jgi:tRNA U34 5-carboxymethylaminomethyl modifying enzyme MnmG/GidA